MPQEHRLSNSSSSIQPMDNDLTAIDSRPEDNESLASFHIRNCRGSIELQLQKSSGNLEQDLPAQQLAACICAHDQYQEDFAESAIRELSHSYPQFATTEIIKGQVLGEGGFALVVQCDGLLIPEPAFRATEKRRSLWHIKKDASPRQTMIPAAMHLALNDEEDEDTETNDRMKDLDVSVDQAESRKFISTHCWRDSGEARYAIKKLKDDVLADPDALFQGIMDLNLETRILSSLPHHPNVIKLRAISSDDRFNPQFFIVLDRLYDTLDMRLQKWSKREESRNGVGIFSCCLPSTRRYQRRIEGLLSSSQRTTSTEEDVVRHKQHYQQTVDRLWAAFDLASALSHLHKHHIMHRDIKPENIGFDIRDDIKVFDLGLAKEIPQDGTDGPWQLTAMCGSPRYMAAEVALGHPYNSKCDVYSFALLVWELLNLEKPFGRVSMHTLKQRVWNETKQRRPRIIIASDNPNHDVATIPQAAWTKQLKDLIERAWAHDPSKRPTMHEMETELRTELTYGIEVMNNVYGLGNDPLLESKRMSHDARRSTFVYQPDAKGSIDGDSKHRKKISQKTDASRSAWFHSSGQSKRGGWSSARNLNNNRQDSSFTQLLSRRNSEISRTILNKE